MSHKESSHQTSNALTVRFPPVENLTSRVPILVAAESECCGFVDWEFGDHGGHLVLTIRGNEEGVIAMAESFGL